tara:strand:- start:95 stop:283 length:189 start_codon:yes stop_codon:yes gene_type:complete
MPNKRTGPDYLDKAYRKRMDKWMKQQADSNFKKMYDADRIEKYKPKPPQPTPPQPPKKKKKK